MEYSKDLLFACMITKLPVAVKDAVTGRTIRGQVKGISFEPGHERNAIVTVGDNVVYHQTDSTV